MFNFYHLGAINAGHRSTRDMWKMDGFGIDILPCVMSERRFLFLLEAVRFDGRFDSWQKFYVNR